MTEDQIFVSYFAGDLDDAAFASRLKSRLEEEGFKTFSNLSLQPGDDWDQTLARELNNSKNILVVLSPGALTADKVRGELKAGLRREKEGAAKVIPLLHKPCPQADVENLVGKKFYADFTNPADFESHFKKLLAALTNGVSQPPPPKPTKGVDPPEPKPIKNGGARKPTPLWKRTAVVVALIGAVSGVIGAIIKSWPPNPPSSDHYGRVINDQNQQPIKDATVFVESKGIPSTHRSDSNGLFLIDADQSLGKVHLRVNAANCKPYDSYLPLPTSGVLDVPLQCSDGKPEPTPAPGPQPVGFTYDHNPTIEEVRTNIQTVRKVSISYRDKRCEQLARNVVVNLNGAQLNGTDAKDILENGARPRTNVQFSVNIRQDGASYEIVCAK